MEAKQRELRASLNGRRILDVRDLRRTAVSSPSGPRAERWSGATYGWRPTTRGARGIAMAVVERAVGDVAVLDLRSDSGERLPPRLRALMDEALATGCTNMVVVMADASTADEALLDAFIACRKILLRRAGDLGIVAPSGVADHAASRVGGWLRFYPTETAAVLASSPSAQRVHEGRSLLGARRRGVEVSTPPRLVRPDWRPAERLPIALFFSFRPGLRDRGHGWSSCRFGCGPNGSKDQTDGTWSSPEGLAHYVEAHAVCLPDEFLEAMGASGWVAPEASSGVTGPPTAEFWVEWASALGQVPASFGACLQMCRDIKRLLQNATADQLSGLEADVAQRLRRVLRTGGLLRCLDDGIKPDPAEAAVAVDDAQAVLERFRELVPSAREAGAAASMRPPGESGQSAVGPGLGH